jgi:hypothetical protein
LKIISSTTWEKHYSVGKERIKTAEKLQVQGNLFSENSSGKCSNVSFYRLAGNCRYLPKKSSNINDDDDNCFHCCKTFYSSVVVPTSQEQK